MKVQLISSSHDNLLEDIAYMARVSNPANQHNTETSEKLVRYLMKHKHWSPFEMVSITMEIRTTRDIARQILRHRSFSFQEFSQRYAVVEDFYYREARLQDPDNRQNSIELEGTEDFGKGGNKTYQERLYEDWNMKQAKVLDASKKAYKWAIDNGIAKEQARAILPEGNTISRLYVNGTLRSWIHYIELRSGNGTQQEHAELALAVAEVIAKIFPLSEQYIAKE
mgnify:CR=1 FL=1